MSWTASAAESAPDAALTLAFAGCLPGGRFSGPLLAFASVPSTQGICQALGAGGAPEGLVVLADHQTAGRGRRGRAWTAPPGTALLFSCLLRPSLETSHWPEVALAAGCAVAEAVESSTGLAARLKWPNDVLIEGRKVAGILAEGILGENPFVVLGIGVNVLQGPGDWSPDVASSAVSLAAAGRGVRREALLATILTCLAARYDELLIRGFGPVRDAWHRRGAFEGRVETRVGHGVAVGLAPDGALVVRHDDGTLTTIVTRDEEGGAGVWTRGEG